MRLLGWMPIWFDDDSVVRNLPRFLIVEVYPVDPEHPHFLWGFTLDEWRIRFQAASGSFREQAAARYNEGTLLRLVDSNLAVVRRAAVLEESGLCVCGRAHAGTGDRRQHHYFQRR